MKELTYCKAVKDLGSFSKLRRSLIKLLIKPSMKLL